VFELDPERGDNVQAAIERTIRPMSWIIRPIARHRLLRTNRPPAHLTMRVRDDSLVVTFEGHPPVVTPRDGSPAPWKSGVSKETYYVKSTISGDTLHQTITASDGHRQDDFTFSDEAGDRLALGAAERGLPTDMLYPRVAWVQLHVVLVAEHLPQPLDYTLEFRRVR
jgi:hypothetical protein